MIRFAYALLLLPLVIVFMAVAFTLALVCKVFEQKN